MTKKECTAVHAHRDPEISQPVNGFPLGEWVSLAQVPPSPVPRYPYMFLQVKSPCAVKLFSTHLTGSCFTVAFSGALPADTPPVSAAGPCAGLAALPPQVPQLAVAIAAAS